MNITFEQIPTILIQTAIWVTLLVILLMLVKMRTQRKSVNFPELFPSDLDVTILMGGKNISTWTNQFSTVPPTPDIYAPFLTEIHNIGSVPAKNIQYGWNFDFEPLIKKISGLDYSNFYNRVQITNNHSIFSLDIVTKENDVFHRGCITPNGISHHEDFLMPANNPTNKISIEIPYAYCVLAGLLINNEYCKEDVIYDKESKLEFLKQFNLNFQMNYEDIDGNKYSKEYLGILELLYTDFLIENQYSKIEGKLKFHQVKK